MNRKKRFSKAAAIILVMLLSTGMFLHHVCAQAPQSGSEAAVEEREEETGGKSKGEGREDIKLQKEKMENQEEEKEDKEEKKDEEEKKENDEEARKAEQDDAATEKKSAEEPVTDGEKMDNTDNTDAPGDREDDGEDVDAALDKETEDESGTMNSTSDDSEKNTGDAAAEQGDGAERVNSEEQQEKTGEDGAGDEEANGSLEEKGAPEDPAAVPAVDPMLRMKSGAMLRATSPQDASAYFHATISANMESYSSGATAIYSVKYKIDRESIHEGDYIYVSVPPELVKSVDFSVSAQHFSNVEDQGNGQYKLTFGPGAESALSGSFSMFLATNEVDEQKTGPVTVGSDSSSITVNAKGPTGTGVLTDVINKDAADNGSAVGYGDYDYSEGYGDSAAQIGVLTRDPGSIKYRLYINEKEGVLSNIVVTDSLPDGMAFDRGRGVEVTDKGSGDAVDDSLYSVSTSGGRLVFRYPGTLTGAIQINYWVVLTSAEPLRGKYTNRADITYEQDGKPYSDHRNYILQGSDYSAANGEKSVDKTEISTDPEDQTVTYTIKFWNNNGFAAGEVSLDDILDPHVRFISASPNEYFSITQDADDPQTIHLVNTKDISGSTTVYVRFMCDFSDVPVGYTVENTVGGNTTKTKKTGGQVTFTASKTVDGEMPDANQTFLFELLDSEGGVLQTKSNSGGEITFDTVPLTKGDLGRTLTYALREKPDQESSLTLDETVYTVLVTVADEADENGVISADVTYQKNGEIVEAAVFNNTTPEEPDIPEEPEKPEEKKVTAEGVKTWKDEDNKEGKRPDSITIHLLADGSEIDKKVVTEADGWKWTFCDLPELKDGKTVTYTVNEDPVQGYTTSYDGLNVTNTYIPDKPEEPEKPEEPDKPEEPEKKETRSYTAVKSSDTAGQLVQAGDQITYRILVRNTGNTALTGLWIRDYIPQYTKYISAGQGGQRGAIDGKQHVDWFIPHIAGGKEAAVTFTVEVLDCVPDGTIIHNTAHTEDTEKPEQPELNTPRNPEDKTNRVEHFYKASAADKKTGSSRGTGGYTSHDRIHRSTSPDTGDSSQILAFLVPCLLSAAALFLLLKKKRS